MSTNATGAASSYRAVTEDRSTATSQHSTADVSTRTRAADAIRRQLANLEVSLANAVRSLQRAASEEMADGEVEKLRAELRDQRSALAALVDERRVGMSPAVQAFPHMSSSAAGVVLKGNTAWNVALNRTA